MGSTRGAAEHRRRTGVVNPVSKSAGPWVRSLVFFFGALIASILFTYGLTHWQVYAEVPLAVTAVYLLLMSIGVVLYGAPRNSSVGQTVHTLLDLIPLQAFVTDEAGRLQYANSALQDLAGPLLPTLSESDVFAIVHPDDEFQARRAFSEGVGLRRSFVFEFRHRRVDGATRRFEVRIQRIDEYSKGIGNWLGVLVDITERSSMGEKDASSNTLPGEKGKGNDQSTNLSMETSISQLTAILVNSQASLRLLSSDPTRLPAAVSCIQRVVQDAKQIAITVREAGPLLPWIGNGRTAHPIPFGVHPRELCGNEGGGKWFANGVIDRKGTSLPNAAR